MHAMPSYLSLQNALMSGSGSIGSLHSVLGLLAQSAILRKAFMFLSLIFLCYGFLYCQKALEGAGWIIFFIFMLLLSFILFLT